MSNNLIIENVRLGKLVHGGQCLAETSDGKKLFVWGGLPGELVNVRITKKKSSYLEGVSEEIIEPSKHRIDPVEPDAYLSSSPWQIMSFEAENFAKHEILQETFEREHVSGVKWEEFCGGEDQFGYRNKVELGFWGDDEGVHYASYIRGTHGKRIITHNALASDAINSVLDTFLDCLNTFIENKQMRAGDFKTVIFRSSRAGEVVAALFCKQEVDFADFKPPDSIKGVVVYHSNPKSPASVPTKQLYIAGDINLTDEVMGKHITYGVLSFFQVNLPVFEQVMSVISDAVKGQKVIDFYSGVGTIGVPLKADVLVEADPANTTMAKENASSETKIVEATSESATEYINSEYVLIVDPPRAGLHKDVVERILEVKPPMVAYLSCNPITQARDIALLQSEYRIIHAQGFNFFPRTPHIESLIVLNSK